MMILRAGRWRVARAYCAVRGPFLIAGLVYLRSRLFNEQTAKMNVGQFRKAGHEAIDRICDYYKTIEELSVLPDVKPGYLVNSLPTSAPQQGEGGDNLGAEFAKHVLPGITHWQHPSFMAYFPANATFESILASLYSASVSNPGFNWLCSPACTELEQVVVDWAAKIFGLSPTFHLASQEGGGLIMGSASDSLLTAAIAARERALRILAAQVEHEDLVAAGEEGIPGTEIPAHVREKYGNKLVLYGSTQTHSLAAKAALLLGLKFRALPVKASENYSLRGEVIRQAMKEDAAAGLIPYFVVATVGTTSTGAIDHVAEIGQAVREVPTAFLHIDAAWAGVALALPEQRQKLRLDEINEHAHSFNTNMHKWGLTNFDCSLLFVRDRKNLTKALDVTPAYLRTKEGDAGTVIDFRNWQLALGRRFRSLQLWFVLKSYGVEGLQTHLRKGITQVDQLADVIRQSPSFELVTDTSLALACFRLSPKGVTHAKLNEINRTLHERLSARRDAFLTQTILTSSDGEEEGIFCFRLATGGVGTQWAHVEAVWDIVEREGVEVLRSL